MLNRIRKCTPCLPIAATASAFGYRGGRSFKVGYRGLARNGHIHVQSPFSKS